VCWLFSPFLFTLHLLSLALLPTKSIVAMLVWTSNKYVILSFYHSELTVQCQGKGCCWVPVSPNPNNDPWCFYPAGDDPCGKLNFTSSGVFLRFKRFDTSGLPFTQRQVDLMYSYFMANINIGGKGGVVASPDTMVRKLRSCQ
jgi:hypothetical protein